MIGFPLDHTVTEEKRVSVALGGDNQCIPSTGKRTAFDPPYGWGSRRLLDQ